MRADRNENLTAAMHMEHKSVRLSALPINGNTDCTVDWLGKREVTTVRFSSCQVALSVQPPFNRTGVKIFHILHLYAFGADSPALFLRKMQLGWSNRIPSNAFSYYLRRTAKRLTGGAA